MKLALASANIHKTEEIRACLPPWIELLGLSELGCSEEIPETGLTLEENAKIKADYIHDKFGINCFADDTGLEVEALGGAPGVFSARYAGQGCSYGDNVEKLLREMEGKTGRKARFRTVISLWWEGGHHFFEGRIEGKILEKAAGEGGFGYDPVFCPEGREHSFAQMTLEEKSLISHRAAAVEKLVNFLEKQRNDDKV